ncbi:DUF2681 domain-containing protein [Ignatzschineria rhizosphaerae]|uniref:DUF2681 domain-containing protein n=1 Tax=Ignatzschineria rhizosphaerae TaxID=2923279 RepID=A0ABY3X446_9GAMM|nr:DUF2681 domain-containing protein [Ignatzschineria rhizosphaerae]UNM95506.1 DUF2681 domain-containing protein [Ignatzschineria rhizosphaerae]UNM96078.1 DUF2681 domain-containing protein [Ignatzschineria rhizosphaerae]
MKNIKQLLGFVLSALSFVFYLLLQREQSKRESVEKELEASKMQNSAAKETLKAIEVKKDVENRNKRDPRDTDERLHDKGYLRDKP